MNIKSAFLSIACLLFSACLFAQTQETSEVRKIADFTAIKVAAAANVVLQKGNSPSIKIVSKGIDLADIITEVKGDELIISLKSCNDSWSIGSFFHGLFKSSSEQKQKQSQGQMTAFVTYTQLKEINVSAAASVNGAVSKVPSLEISVSGAADAKITDVETGDLTLSVSGAANLWITGKAKKTTVEASGAADVQGYNLISKSAKIRASGAADVNLSVENELEAYASGASSVYYKGNPAKNISNVRSGSSIERLKN